MSAEPTETEQAIADALGAGESPEGAGPAAAPKRKRGRPKGSKTGAGDRAPRKQKSGAAKRKERAAGELAEIEQAFAELLAMPSIPAAMAGDQWAAAHFADRGPALAKRLAIECERNKKLRDLVLRAIRGQGTLMLASELFFYAGLPLMHFGILPGGEQFGVPVIGGAKRRSRAPGPRPGAEPPFTPPVRPEPPASHMEPEPEPEPAAPNGNGGSPEGFGWGGAPPPPVAPA